MIFILICLLFSVVHCSTLNCKDSCIAFEVDTMVKVKYANTLEEKQKIVLNGIPTITFFTIDPNDNIYTYISPLSKLIKFNKQGSAMIEQQIPKPLHSLSLSNGFLFAFTGDEILKIDTNTLKILSTKTVGMLKGISSCFGLTFSFEDYIFICNINKSVTTKFGEEFDAIYHIPSGKSTKITNKKDFLPLTNFRKEDFEILRELLFSKTNIQYCGQSNLYVIFSVIDSANYHCQPNRFYIYNKLNGKIKCICNFNYPVVKFFKPSFISVKDNEFIFQTHFVNKDMSNTAIFHILKIIE